MTKLKGSNKNMGVLRKDTHYKPQLRNQTRWTGVFTMMDNFLRMRNPMILALTNKDTDFPMDQSEDFEAKARNIRKMLFNINEVTKLLQTSKQPLNWSRRYLDSLINQANSLREEPQSEWYGNQFGEDYIGPHSMKIPTESKHFISGVIKIQRGHVTEMTEAEKSACKKMKTAPAAAGADADDKEEDFLSQLKRLKELERSSSAAAGRKRSHIQISTAGNQADEYVNANFVLGSAAEVERQWSIAGNLLDPGRAKMSPQLFEAIMMLKYNERFWLNNTSFVGEAMDLASSARKAKRAQKILQSAQ
ncbi:unnamed protein product, partial [Cylindrotheca closterium]